MKGATLGDQLRQHFPRHSGLRAAWRGLRRLRKRLARLYRDPLAQLFSWVLPASIMRDPRYFRLWQRRGLHVLRRHFYSPVPDTAALSADLFERRSEGVGIDWNTPAQLALLERLSSGYRDEYDCFPVERSEDPLRFTLANGSFGSPDAEVLYAMLRHFKPRRMIEIGSGHSTLLAVQALKANRDRDGRDCRFTAIEPFPDRRLRSGIPGVTRLIAEPVQDVPLSVFEELGEDDVLFIDSSHVLKTGSDVQYEYLEVLPRLKPGVLVHLHDIFLPAEYPRQWVLERQWFFNEQYLLQAFLAFNRRFEVIWAGHHLYLAHPSALRAAFGACASGRVQAGGGSFWIRSLR